MVEHNIEYWQPEMGKISGISTERRNISTLCYKSTSDESMKPTVMTQTTTVVTRDSTAAPSILQQRTSISSMIQDDSKRNDDFLFTCS